MKKIQCAVIGIGRFGASLIRELIDLDYEVLAIDNNSERVHKASEIATKAVEADAMDETVLRALGILNFDIVFVAIGENMQANILTTILLKELGAKRIIAKAQDDLHGKVLAKIGADLVVYPERDMAIKIARSLFSSSILDYLELSPKYSLVELYPPPSLENRSLIESNIRKKHQINILAIRRNDEIIVSPHPNERFQAGDVLVILGENKAIQSFSNLK